MDALSEDKSLDKRPEEEPDGHIPEEALELAEATLTSGLD